MPSEVSEEEVVVVVEVGRVESVGRGDPLPASPSRTLILAINCSLSRWSALVTFSASSF